MICDRATMFLKKLLGSNNDSRQEKGKNEKAVPPQGVQTMGVNLQRKFAKGVQYNSEYIQPSFTCWQNMLFCHRCFVKSC